LDFYAVTGSAGATGSGNYMESLWNNAILDISSISYLNFYSSGFSLSQTILSS
jgi:hypothetical protein